MANTAVVTVGPTWQLVINTPTTVTISAFRGHYGELCNYAGVPPESLDGHEIDYFEPELSAYRATGEVYGRSKGGPTMKLIIT